MTRSKRFIASAAAGAAIIASTGSASQAAVPISTVASPPVQAASAPNGEAIFRGLFFAQGPVAAKFPALAAADVAPPVELSASLNRLVAELRKNDPTFFDRFGAAMTSGKRHRIAAALSDAQQSMVTVVRERQGSESPQGAAKGDCIWAFAVAVVTLAVAGNVAYAVNAVRSGNVAWNVNWFWSAPNDSTSKLRQERWVNEIATALS